MNKNKHKKTSVKEAIEKRSRILLKINVKKKI